MITMYNVNAYNIPHILCSKNFQPFNFITPLLNYNKDILNEILILSYNMKVVSCSSSIVSCWTIVI
jgi:hypothetical protein